MPNPLTDELSDDAKAELAAVFADLKRHYDELWGRPARAVKPWRNRPWERSGW